MIFSDNTLLIFSYSNSVMDVFSWNSPATGLPLQQASMNPLDGDPGGWMDDTLVNLQVIIELRDCLLSD